MAEIRLTGTIEWYDDRGYGLIRGNDRQEYFAHESNIDTSFSPRRGAQVSFQSRPRSRGKIGMEAFDVKPQVEDQRTIPEPTQSLSVEASPSQVRTPPSQSKDPASDIQRAAQEALRLKRERRQGLRPAYVETLPPGTRVQHAEHGVGVVELASLEIISVRFDVTPYSVLDLPRSAITKFVPKPKMLEVTQTLNPAAKRSPVQKTDTARAPGMTIGQFVLQLKDEVQQTLLEEGLEDIQIYAYDGPGNSSTPPKSMQIDPRVADAFRKTSGITEFYSHQIEVRQALLAGKNVVICTPTASGKTEAYNPTILETLLNDSVATALYLFPLVALGIDQAERLEKLNDALPQRDKLAIMISNSGVDSETKKVKIREKNRILVTTPDSLHHIFLRNSYPNWRRFFNNLRYVVVDEAHLYKGVLGANMANLLRRLFVRCRREGNRRFPQLVISSATVRRPDHLANQLSGLKEDSFTVITRSGAPTPGRHFLAVRSDNIPDVGALCIELLDVVTTDVGSKELRPVRTIVFMRSISEVKKSVDLVHRQLRRLGQGHRENQINAYYADKGDKREVLKKLQRGDISCLFTTSALMAGIDIGGLDVSIVKRFPGLIMDARQMFGRAGRAGEGAAIFIASRAEVFDQFYFERSNLLFKGPTEEVIANPENPVLLAAHLKCAAHVSNTNETYDIEGPLLGSNTDLFGAMGQDLLRLLLKDGTLRIQNGAYYHDKGYPHSEAPLSDLRSMSGETYILLDTKNNRELEQKRRATAFRDAHPEALIWVNGETYRVSNLNRDTYEIKCVPESVESLRTQGVEQRTIEILSEERLPTDGRSVLHGGGVGLYAGGVKITTSILKYKIYRIEKVMQCRKRSCRHESADLDTARCILCGSPVRIKQTEKVQEERPIPISPPLTSTLETRSCWLVIPPAVQQKYECEFWPRWINGGDDDSESFIIAPSFEYAVHSVEHALQKAFPEILNCDRDEIGGIYDLNPHNQTTRLFIYDNFPGGLGLADEFAADPTPVIEAALDVLERCTCGDDQGCPVCLPNFGCDKFNQSLSKLAGRYLLRLLLGADTSTVINELKEYTSIYILPSKTITEPNVDNASAPSFDGNWITEEEDGWWEHIPIPPEIELFDGWEESPF